MAENKPADSEEKTNEEYIAVWNDIIITDIISKKEAEDQEKDIVLPIGDS